MWRPLESFGDDDVANPVGIDAPKGHRRSGRRAWRDGLAAQTVIANLENPRSYRAFERAIIGSISPSSVLELELACRVANLLWRLRRVSAIETGLFEIHGQEWAEPGTHSPKVIDSEGPNMPPGPNGKVPRPNGRCATARAQEPPLQPETNRGPLSRSRILAERFRHLCKLSPEALDGVGGYEARLWRQLAQTIWMLDTMRRPPPAGPRRPYRRSAGYLYWGPGPGR
jgi:hypothetical protein